MAFIERGSCTIFGVIFLIFHGLSVGLSEPDKDFHQYDLELISPEQVDIVSLEDHNIRRRNIDPQPLGAQSKGSDADSGTNEPHVTLTHVVKAETNGSVPPQSYGSVQTTSSTSTDGSLPKKGKSYMTAKGAPDDGNAAAAAAASSSSSSSSSNPEDTNRTSQPAQTNTTGPASSANVPNSSPAVQQAPTINNNTSVPKKNETVGADKPSIEEGKTVTTTNITDIDDVTISKYLDDDEVNKTVLHDHNITKISEDYHQYYNSCFISYDEKVGHSYWVEMANRTDIQINDMLSQSHRRAATVKLSFDFPFYGHLVRNVTIATGGFLYTGEYVHSWLAATQYIAPLMANFDTSISNDSYVKYVDNGTAFTVEWEKVVLQDKPNSGNFTFQATLHKNGDIVFVYQSVPITINSIQDDLHPVKVGLSDAYIIDRTIFFVRRKTIYEYHRVNFNRQEIKNWTVIIMKALPTCLDMHDCENCASQLTGFACTWCPGANRCSSGMDRYRQEWILKGCDKTGISNDSYCPAPPANVSSIPATPGTASGMPPAHNSDTKSNDKTIAEDPHSQQSDSESHKMIHDKHDVSMGISGIIGILFIIALVMSLAFWVFYAYRNPHTASGQLLIRYRPSQWSWKRGEARYTAATIHM